MPAVKTTCKETALLRFLTGRSTPTIRRARRRHAPPRRPFRNSDRAASWPLVLPKVAANVLFRRFWFSVAGVQATIPSAHGADRRAAAHGLSRRRHRHTGSSRGSLVPVSRRSRSLDLGSALAPGSSRRRHCPVHEVGLLPTSTPSRGGGLHPSRIFHHRRE